jgi:Amt family ammonium transporter
MTGGIGALSGVIVLGPRKGRFEDPIAFEPHSLPLVVLGTLILWPLGLNLGSCIILCTRTSHVIEEFSSKSENWNI